MGDKYEDDSFLIISIFVSHIYMYLLEFFLIEICIAGYKERDTKKGIQKTLNGIWQGGIGKVKTLSGYILQTM